MKNNELRIDLAGNPGVSEFLGAKRPGDKCEFTVRGTVKTVDPNNDAVISIDKIIYESGEKKEVEPEPDKPMRMEMKMAK